MSVRALGYLGIEATDLGAWRRYAAEFLGLMEAAATDSAGPELRLRMDSRAWRIAVAPGPADDVAYLGFEVADQASLAALGAHLQSMGVAVREDAELAAQRGVTQLLATQDPSGLAVELYCGATEAFETPARSGLASGFVTGEQGLGHVVLHAGEETAARRFYMQGLGFRLSDTVAIRMGGGQAVDLTFLHCNPRHHTVALAPAKAPKRLNHVMLQVANLDDVGAAYDRAAQMNIAISSSLGRHTNDHMLSFYARTPSGFDVEYGFGARTVGDNWTVVRHDRGSMWGHKRPARGG